MEISIELNIMHSRIRIRKIKVVNKILTKAMIPGLKPALHD